VDVDKGGDLRPDEREINHWCPGYRPGEGQVCRINPPRFSWLYYIPGPDRPRGAYRYYSPFDLAKGWWKTALMRFRFQIAKDAGVKQCVVDKQDLWYPWDNTIAPLEGAGPWHWRVGYSVKGSGEVEWCRTRTFTIAKDAVVWDRSPLADREYLASKGIGTKGHPRYIFSRAEMPRLRALLAKRPDLLKRVRDTADRAIQAPWWQDFPTDDDTGWSGPQYSPIAAGMRQVALAWLLTGDEKYLACRPRFLKMARWWEKANKPGATGPEYMKGSSGSRGVNGRCAKALAAAYDWMYDRWSEADRALLRKGLEWRLAAQEQTSGCSSSVCHPRWGPGQLPFVIGSHVYEDHMDLIPAAIAICDESRPAWESFESNVNYLMGVTVSGNVGNPDQGFAAGFENYGTWHWHNLMEALVRFEASFPEVGFGRNPVLDDYAAYFIYCRPPGVRCASWGTYSANYASYANYIPWRLWETARVTRQRVYHKWARAYDRAHRNRGFGRQGIIDAYLDLLKPWREDLREPDLSGGYARLFRPLGFVTVSSSAPFTQEAMRRGVGMTFACHPAGKPSHGFHNDGTFDIRAYGEVIATGGGSSHNWSATGKTSLGHNCILFDGDGQGGPGVMGGGAVVQKTTRGRWEWPGYPRVARIVAFQQQGDTTYFCGDSTFAYRLDHVKRVRRHVLFVRKKYFVIFDEVRTSKPSRITWLYHVDQDVPLTVIKDGIGFDYRMREVEVRVRQTATPDELECVNYQDEAWMKNPLNGSDLILKDWKTGHPGGRLMKHNLWITTRQPATKRDFLTVIYPYRTGSPAPTIQRLDGGTVRVSTGGETDVISFGAGTRHPATITVKVNDIGARTNAPHW